MSQIFRQEYLQIQRDANPLSGKFVIKVTIRMQTLLNSSDQRFFYDILGVKISLITDSPRLIEEAAFFLGAHHTSPCNSPDYEIILKEQSFRAEPHVECQTEYTDGGVLFATNESSALLNPARRIAIGKVHPNPSGGKTALPAVSLLNMLVLRMMADQNYIPLHASAVVSSGKLLVLTGRSGSGKSTLALELHRLGFPLVADDLIYIKLTDNGIMGGGHYQPLKLHAKDMDSSLSKYLTTSLNAKVPGKSLIDIFVLHPEGLNHLYPIHSVMSLERGAEQTSSIEHLPETTGVFNLLDSLHFGKEKGFRKQAFETLSAMQTTDFLTIKRGNDPSQLAQKIANMYVSA